MHSQVNKTKQKRKTVSVHVRVNVSVVHQFTGENVVMYVRTASGLGYLHGGYEERTETKVTVIRGNFPWCLGIYVHILQHAKKVAVHTVVSSMISSVLTCSAR